MSYRTKTVSELTGIPRNTLVAWERRYDLLDLARAENGYRLYTDADVAYLKRLKEKVDRGMSISEAISETPRTRSPSPDPPLEEPLLHETLVQQLLAPLSRFDRDAAAPLLRRVEQLPFEVAIHEVWIPLLNEVGVRWERGEYAVVQEHFTTEVAREHVHAMFRALGSGVGSGPHVACASLPDDPHGLPPLLLSVLFALRGWRVTWLGASVPIEDLCAFSASQAPDLVCLSAFSPRDPEAILEIARKVLSCSPPRTVIALGGPALRGALHRGGPRLWLCADDAELFARWQALVSDSPAR